MSANAIAPVGTPTGDRARQELFEATFRSSLFGIVRVNIDGRFEVVNDRFCQIVGWSRDALLSGMTVADVTYPDDREETYRLFGTLAQDADDFEVEKRYLRPDGSLVWVSNGVTAIRDDAGKLIGAVAIVNDVTDRHRAEDALLESEQQYRELIEGLGVAVYTTDDKGRITMFNEAAAEMWGRRPELGKDLWCGSLRIYTPDGVYLPHDECPMAVTLKTNEPVRGTEAIAERPDGTRVNFLPFPSPLRDESGKLIGAVNVLVDITERKRAEADADQQRELIQAIADNMSVGLLMTDVDFRIEFMNRAAERITGYRFEDVRGKTKHNLIHRLHRDGSPFPIADCPIEAANARMEKVIGHEDVFVRPDGTMYDVVCNVVPIVHRGVRVGAIMDLRDATEEKRAAEAIQQSLAIKDQFLSLVSHELRTPIATILGNALLLVRRADQISAENRQQALLDVASETGKLQRIIENLLLMTRMDAGQTLETEPLRLAPLLTQVVTSFERRHPSRMITITGERDAPVIVGQPTVLSLVLENLISNADKYSPLERPIEIMVRPLDGQVEITVRDYGIGLDPEETESIFTPFYRSATAKTKAKGIGLGLAVCKRGIESQGGCIRAIAREDGCDFVFTLLAAES